MNIIEIIQLYILFVRKEVRMQDQLQNINS